ncbi:pyridoxamine 5'-phosphate oxidase family protein [Ottowia thiooxydans]|uniref:pyridoxamine 5'-phosphate oxidase family protein n=1 Tax=Ottowia thiooxydans TaxID=219182 RepID=UPI00042806CA|nr:pyridoxamine 5'-phosphate oxidase family protein [Ottowia thiooxydans]
MTITEDMVAVIARAKLAFFATVNEDGTPNLSPKASLTVRENALCFANMASPHTVENLKRNPAIAINVVDIFSRRGYRFSGKASILTPVDPGYASVAEWVWEVNGKQYPVHEVISVEVTDASPLFSPAYKFGGDVNEQELRVTYLEKYGVRDL